MDTAITVGDVLVSVLVIGGVVGVLALLMAVLSAYAKGFTH
jgi:hypothetical protein